MPSLFPGRAIKSASVVWTERRFLCSDRVSGDEARDTLLADLIGAFGFPSQSSEFDDCRLLKRGSPQPVLTPVDRKDINFCYKHVPPGTKASGLKKIFKDHWQP